MQHILLECDRTARKLIWKVTDLWPYGLQSWPNVTGSMEQY